MKTRDAKKKNSCALKNPAEKKNTKTRAIETCKHLQTEGFTVHDDHLSTIELPERERPLTFSQNGKAP